MTSDRLSKSPLPNISRIEVCGGIGIGKSTLAGRIAASFPECELICEDFRANPLWQAYYGAPHTYVREKNISFLAQHFAELKHASSSLVVSDFSPAQDLAYAKVLEDAEHLSVMTAIYQHLSRDIAGASLIVHLTAPIDQQFRQIALRGRKEEVALTKPSLQALNQALREVVDQLSSTQCVLHIDASQVDIRSDVRVIQSILPYVTQPLIAS